MFTDRNGRPRLMPKSLEETVMFTNEDEGFLELFDRLLAYSSTKQSVKMSENKRDDRMDVDALSKGKRKGKKVLLALESAARVRESNVVCWNCDMSGHYEKDCRPKWTQDKALSAD